MGSTRLPRFKRAAEIAPIQLTERDHAIIRLVHRYRFLRSSHIVALIGGSRQQILRRLQRLFHHGFLDRPRAQIDYFHRGGSQELVYGMGSNSAPLFLQARIQSRVAGDNSNRSIGRLFLEHALLTSDVMVALELACRRNGRVRFLIDEELPLPSGALRRREPFQWSVNVNSRTKIGVIPDRVFALEFSDQPGGRNRVLFFLEADRGTMPVSRPGLERSSFRRKLIAYEASWQQNLHQTTFGFNRFRVLTVTSGAERSKNLSSAAGQLAHGHGLFLFTNIETFRSHPDILKLPWEGALGRPPESLLDSIISISN